MTIHHRETDSFFYLNYSSSHPVRCKNSILYGQLLRLRRIAVKTTILNIRRRKLLVNSDTSHILRLWSTAQWNVSVPYTAKRPCKQASSHRQDNNLFLTYHPNRNIIIENCYPLKNGKDKRFVNILRKRFDLKAWSLSGLEE